MFLHMRRFALASFAFIALLFSIYGIFGEDLTPKAAAHYHDGDYQAGIDVLLFNTDYNDANDLNWKLDQLFDRLIQDHVNSISLAWPIYTEGVTSTVLKTGEKTPTDTDLLSVLNKAHERGFMMTLHPIIDENVLKDTRHGDWRGNIRPTDPKRWFENYTAIMLRYATLAETGHADAIAVGTELNSMEKYTDSWRDLIGKVRSVFHGKLTYSANAGVAPKMPWDALDFVSINAFFELQSPNDASVEQMINSWQKWIPSIDRRIKEIGKEAVFSEIGAASQPAAHVKSWYWSHGGGIDLEDQRRFYAAVCAVWKNKLRGIYWWDTTIWFLPDPAHDGSFMPLGKPAEAEIASCFAQPK
jgi:hypothetical protein